jgi:hypothetical protein
MRLIRKYKHKRINPVVLKTYSNIKFAAQILFSYTIEKHAEAFFFGTFYILIMICDTYPTLQGDDGSYARHVTVSHSIHSH